MNLAEFSFRRKTTVYVVTILLFVGGLVYFQNLGRLEDPNFTIKEAVVFTTYPGATAYQVELEVTEHSHGNQWGIVVAGEMELTIGGETRVFGQGDSYYIPAGVTHGAILYAGFRALDFFEDRDRYKVKK